MNTRPPVIRASFLRPGEIVVDSFAGGGGASTGIEAALDGRPIDIAINHDAEAIACHRANHPETTHYQEDVWQVDPIKACAGRPVGLAWFSPDCKHFSVAKGSSLCDQKIRALAWVVIRWARTVRPRVICLENVGAFKSWGPLDNRGKPIKAKAGRTFKMWLGKLKAQGYQVEFRELVAADYGSATARKRLYMVARCDGQPIVWPEPTHGRGLAPHRGAGEIINFDLPMRSIFGRKKPLAEATLNRIAMGMEKFVIGTAQPFIVRHGHYSTITGAGLREGCGAGLFRGQSINTPLATVCATNDKHLVVAFIAKTYGGPNGHQTPGQSLGQPLGTITAKDHHVLATALLAKHGSSQLPLLVPDRTDEVRAFLVKYYGSSGRPSQQSLFEPLHTVTSRSRFGLVTVHSEEHRIVDIQMRMLEPRELFDAHDFPADYIIDPIFEGKPLTKTAQTRLAGNSVVKLMAEAVVAAQAPSASSVAA